MLKIGVNIFYKPIEQLKSFLLQNKDLYIPINGGASLKNDPWCQQYVFFDDFIDDSISSHNKLLNENTSIYWLWKSLENFKDIDYIGFNHYRRFFPRSELVGYDKYDIIVAQPIKCIYSLEWQYCYYHSITDLQQCIKLLKDKDIQFGLQFQNYMKTNHDNFAPMNMFVMRRNLFEEWCSFIFPVLFKLEEVIDVSGRDNYQKRAICFLEERIFGFWCWMKKNAAHMKVLELPVIEHLEWKDNQLNERGTYDR